MNTEEPQAEPVAEQQPVVLDKETSIQIVLNIALHHGGVVKGISEVIKALEAQKVKIIFLAEDCDSENYKATLNALAGQFNVPVVEVKTWVELKDYCKLGLLSTTITEIAQQKGKEPKIKPRCSSCAIIDWGEDSEARKFLEKNLSEEK